MNYLAPSDIKFDEAIEEIIEICERYEINEKMSPLEKSEKFKKKFSKLYLENFKRAFTYMQAYDYLITRSKDEKLAKGMLGVLFEDLTMEGFEYYGKDGNGNVINPYVEGDPLDQKLHKELNKIQGPDDNLEIERFSTSNPTPKRNVQKDYFIQVIKEYAGFADVKKDKLELYWMNTYQQLRDILEIKMNTLRLRLENSLIEVRTSQIS